MQILAKLALVGTYLSTILATSISNVRDDFTAITQTTQELDNAIIAFSAQASLVNALGIHTIAVNLHGKIDQTTTDVNVLTSKPISEADGKSILQDIAVLKPVFEKTLADLKNSKEALTGLPVGGVPAIVLKDLRDTSASTFALEAALIVQTPDDFHAEAGTIITSINASLAATISAFS